ncbi:MAG: Rpn family recombination-promoting nuclease/putative transposase, partial [Polyangiaceae bacterium]|nr:Rpn family recombination-promoting nuclease/putative transposase [Polyangiaceae bacterium]
MPARPRREMLPQPHDALFKWTFGQRQHAAGLLRAALPPEVVAAIDFRSLRIEKDSFVDPA